MSKQELKKPAGVVELLRGGISLFVSRAEASGSSCWLGREGGPGTFLLGYVA